MSFASPSRRAAPIGNGNVLLNKYLKMMGEIPLLNREDEVEVARLIDAGGPDAEIAKATLVNANLRLVVAISKHVAWRWGRG